MAAAQLGESEAKKMSKIDLDEKLAMDLSKPSSTPTNRNEILVIHHYQYLLGNL
ncbi:predicted protein [Sclerotinia sclerotiorum 1980 UF-70]|uniref:Uncharacterized protein n=1 Tax=Sclerotinia sclerotiorum (strain ATCC 18683 / 1980 / Ss-1) TaxID=665079 RepID=A7ERK7_SCLS1|nr:predicted protein [Sclerotinia sclerotiorum 1980 UF-70]EDN92099.1 predicted protein [Sclerotinia sclerotiorum 1980 UF-70]